MPRSPLPQEASAKLRIRNPASFDGTPRRLIFGSTPMRYPDQAAPCIGQRNLVAGALKVAGRDLDSVACRRDRKRSATDGYVAHIGRVNDPVG
jgi:hypothetical protein